jgi:hypothetical protein
MGEVVEILGIPGLDYFSDYMLDADCVAGACALRSTSTSSAGEVVNASTTGAADAVGLYGEAVTYTATPASGSLTSVFGLLAGNETLGAIARIINHPFQVVRWRANGGATSGTALVNHATTRSNILTNTSADTTKLIVSAANVGTVSFAGGIIKGRTGANMGQTRRIITHNNAADERTEVAFLNTIAVGDTFLAFPWSKASIAVQLTTDLTEADAIIVVGTGAPMRVVKYEIDVENDAAFLYTMFSDHYLNPESS